MLCAGTQQAPSKPMVKLDTAAGPLVLSFQSLTDRDDAVDLLKQLKPPTAAAAASGSTGAGAAGPKGSTAAGGSSAAAAGGGGKLLLPSAQQAAALFKSDPDLHSLYKSLVVAGILIEAEFWRTRQVQLRSALAGGGGGGAESGPKPVVRQRVGLPSAMLADVKPSADGQTEKVHYKLTPKIIQQARLGQRGQRGQRGWVRRGEAGQGGAKRSGKGLGRWAQGGQAGRAACLSLGDRLVLCGCFPLRQGAGAK